jgi:spermidine synthase
MIPWQLLERAKIPGSKSELTLHQHDDELSIRSDGLELMNSRTHASEDRLAELACEPIAARPRVHVLIGGLGMGFSLRAALSCLRADAKLTVAELVPAVVEWNRSHLAALAGRPLEDARVSVKTSDVAELLRQSRNAFDAIVLDVDNGPAGMGRASNDWLYARAGLTANHRALRTGGVLAVWSASPDSAFTERLRDAGFEVRVVSTRGRAQGKGARHTIWLATAGDEARHAGTR